MATTTPDRPTATGPASATAADIVERWLDTLPDDAAQRRSEELLDGYRSLGVALLEHALRPVEHDGIREDVHAGDLPGLHHVLGRVVAVTRREGLAIATVVEDVGQIVPITSEGLAERGEGVAGSPDVLTGTHRVALAVGNVVYRLVRLLEESAARARRERSEDLAAMTDMLSHELKNRLGAARTASQLLLGSEVRLDERGLERAARVVQSSIAAGLRTVEDVRALAVARSSPGDEKVRVMALPQLVRGTVDRLRSEAETREVRVEVEGDVVDCRVDASRLRLIVFNLLLNGIKYSDAGAEERWVRVGAERTGSRVRIRICDNGVGIPEDELDDIFLYRVRGSDAEGVPGSGLGLAIVKEAVDQIGAEIAVESRVGSGTAFTVTFDPLDGP